MKLEISTANNSLDYRLLMQFRIHEILIVSSVYDAFKLQEDGHLHEMLMSEFAAYNLSTTPRMTRVSTAQHAFRKMQTYRYDMIITMAHIVDMNAFSFAREIKNKYGDIPVVMLTANKTEHTWLLKTSEHLDAIDKIFYWYGDSSIFPAIIKYIEDKRNAERDILKGMSRAIIVVEDSPEFYSIFLPLFYKVVIKSVDDLIRVEYTDEMKLFRMYSRPKILLCSTYEEALGYFEKYYQQVLTVISDVRYPMDGKMNATAGVKLLQKILGKYPSLPVLLFSKEPENAAIAEEIGAYFLDKNSNNLVKDLKRHIINHCGFGDLIFTTPDKKEIDRAESLESLQRALQNVPLESIEYHARRNHFSNWLANRGYFQLADQLKPLVYSDFVSDDAGSDLRQVLIEGIAAQRKALVEDKVVLFNRESYDPQIKYIRMGDGSIGGKARGLVFLVNYLKRFNFKNKFPDITIDIPNFVVLSTDIYDSFMESNNLMEEIGSCRSDEDINALFLAGTFSRQVREDFRYYLKKNTQPLAVRSSSLLEDNYFEPFAGIYTTLMVPNCSTNLSTRLKQLEDAVKLVYASTFHQNARAYMTATGHRSEDEKMAVVIQQLIGKTHGSRFYPTFSGVMQSYNYYPQQKLKREDGLANIALGLGRTVVEGEKSLKFSPRYPKIIPQFFSTQSIFKSSQNRFWSLHLAGCEDRKKINNEDSNLELLDLDLAEKDGELQTVGSVYHANSDTFRENFYETGTRAVTFANILKWKMFPLSESLVEVQKIMKSGMGSEIEMEFAANIYNDGSRKGEFFILQIRPQITYANLNFIQYDALDAEDFLARSEICLGNGVTDDIHDVLYISRKDFNILETQKIVEELRGFNDKFDRKRKYILLGPGRWGTADPMLGIPVAWMEISNARCIVEIGLDDLYLEPSFGSHFFQNITSLNISYFTLPPSKTTSDLQWDWLDTIEPVDRSKHIRHLHFDKPLIVQVEGMTGKGLILKPGYQRSDDRTDEEMNNL